MPVRSKFKDSVVYPLGEYPARLISVDEGETGEFGPTWLWTFRLAEPKYNGAEITAISSQTYSTRSKAYRWAVALGHPPKTDLDASQIENAPCFLALVVETDDEGVEYNRIQAIRPAKGGQVPIMPPPPPDDDFTF